MDWRAHIRRHGSAVLPGEPWAKKLLIALVLLGAVLRFWDLPNLPYTHDELSALHRLHPTLSQTIADGVIANDTHPPGVQVFEWFWARLFSLEEADMKLPFILMSLAAIVLLYRFALAWTGSGAALMLAALMVTLQYSVFYGQLARPYAAGLFTTALLADQLTRWLANGNRKALIGSAFAMVASGYVHHFSLLLAILMALTGLLLATAGERKQWLMASGAACLLYLPNLPIFITQLNQGGLSGWLQAPGADWLTQYAAYIAHWSPFLGAALIIAVIISVTLSVRSGTLPAPTKWMLILWGAAPLAIGYCYSVWRAPVLQYSVVLFSFPYLALFFLQGLRHLPKRTVVMCTILVAGVSVHSLVHARKHYTVNYHSKYEAMLLAAIDATKQLERDQVLVLFETEWHMVDFYKRHWGVPDGELNAVNILGMPQARIDSILAVHAGDHVLLGRSNGGMDESPALVQQRFPRLADRRDLVEGQVLRFSRRPIANQRFDRDTVAHLAPAHQFGPWEVSEWIARSPSGWDMAGHEFGMLIDIGLDSVAHDAADAIEVVLDIDGYSPDADAAIVAELHGADSSLFYRTGELEPTLRAAGQSSLVVALCPSYSGAAHGARLRTYVHNRSKGPLQVRSFTVLRRDANPVRDAVLGPIPWLGRFPPE
ncbi:MAG: glycosyltransferase family 39 protein [Flavobacteriales bacterium]|nr:glycosyltransferase family 39 protein [Flavobacteriales bacterium]